MYQVCRVKGFQKQLIEDGVISSDRSRIIPLQGGVSSDIYLIEDGDKRFVVKRALEKLKVEADWYADTSRNKAESDFIDFVETLRPGVVPKISAKGDGYFAMEFLGDGFRNWKADLLAGNIDVRSAEQAGKVLADIHRQSAGRPDLAEQFEHMDSFWQLRLEPYLLVVAEKHSDLRFSIEKVAFGLKDERIALIHGDFSPKNIVISSDRWVLLDCEVACYGDPAFDVAFLINHLLLKALYHKKYYQELSVLVDEFWCSYKSNGFDLDLKVSRLLPMLLLGRVDGKSPVEYLVEESEKEFVRGFSTETILHPSKDLETLVRFWFKQLSEFQPQSEE
ncbi:MAG: aminoglycoside phosphotransferase [Opitutaceae bacterium]|nr:aminoglycoside phosphotransferase [Opitutaceae bacterium]